MLIREQGNLIKVLRVEPPPSNRVHGDVGANMCSARFAPTSRYRPSCSRH